MTLPLLAIKNLTKTYTHKGKITPVLQDISFDLFPGTILSLLGVNGAGKTKLSSIIASLIPPTSGEVLWNGESIYKNLYSYRKTIGFCPQKPNLDPSLTLDQNLFFAGHYYGLSWEETRERKRELISRFSLEKYIDHSMQALSQGYRQRFLLARTLMHAPQILILDEPTVGLDPSIRNEILTLIEQLKQEGKSVFLTTHYLDEAEKLSDYVVMINEGTVTASDSPKQLLDTWNKKNLEEIFLELIQETNAENYEVYIQ